MPAPDMTRGESRRRQAAEKDQKNMQDGVQLMQQAGETQREREKRLEVAGRLAQYAHTAPLVQAAEMEEGPSTLQQTVGEGEMELQNEERGMGETATISAAAAMNVTDNDAGEREQANGGREPTLTDVLQAIALCKNDITGQIGALKMDVSLIRQDMQKFRERLTTAENRISGLEDTVNPLSKNFKVATESIARIWNKTDDLENRLRRNNVRIVGVPEKAEGREAVEFFESWLLKTFGKDKFSKMFAIERAHRVPTRPVPPGHQPRMVLIKMLHFRDRDKILQLARSASDLRIEGARVSLYPDFSVEVQKKRAQFQDVKRRLRALQVQYSMIYPARLRVEALGGTHFFESSKEAMKWLDLKERQIRDG